MSLITKRRIARFCRDIFDMLGGGNIGFVDVGSGGPLKEPWALLPKERLTNFDFDPTNPNAGKLPLCISNKSGTAQFFVARDERASSFHKPLEDFVGRYGLESMLTKETISVACTSLDEHFVGRYESVEALDINVEGHDFQVLQGAEKLLSAGAVKLLKVEFELVPVYEGQGYFSDVDAFLRARNFMLADIEIEHGRPVNVRHLYHRGEPIWGKALYAPTQTHLRARLTLIHDKADDGAARKELAVAVALYTASQLPGHAYDVISRGEEIGVIAASEAVELRTRLGYVFQWARHEKALSRGRDLLLSAIRGLIWKI